MSESSWNVEMVATFGAAKPFPTHSADTKSRRMRESSVEASIEFWPLKNR